MLRALQKELREARRQREAGVEGAGAEGTAAEGAGAEGAEAALQGSLQLGPAERARAEGAEAAEAALQGSLQLGPEEEARLAEVRAVSPALAELFARLNPAQLAAVLAEDRAAFVRAQVGSGKTTVLVYKVLYLHLVRGVPLREIAVLTFTTKAAAELRARLAALRPEAEASPHDTWLMGTFHGVAHGLLARALPVERLGYTRRFGVLDEEEREALLERLVEAHGLRVGRRGSLARRLAELRVNAEGAPSARATGAPSAAATGAPSTAATGAAAATSAMTTRPRLAEELAERVGPAPSSAPASTPRPSAPAATPRPSAPAAGGWVPASRTPQTAAPPPARATAGRRVAPELAKLAALARARRGGPGQGAAAPSGAAARSGAHGAVALDGGAIARDAGAPQPALALGGAGAGTAVLRDAASPQPALALGGAGAGIARDAAAPQPKLALGGGAIARDAGAPQPTLALGGAGAGTAVLRDAASPFAAAEVARAADLSRLAALYRAQKLADAVMDFDDLVEHAAALLAEVRGAGAFELAPRWILIDEAQDADPREAELVARLAGPDTRLFAVGDPLQSIYGWRGSGSDALVRRCADRAWQDRGLPASYRSTRTILEAARAVLGAQPASSGPLVPVRSFGERVIVRRHHDPTAEAIHLTDRVRLHLAAGVPPRDIGVLARLNAQLEPIARMFAEHGIPVAGADAPELDGVRLLSLHAAKGLELRHVYITGVNHGLLPLAHGATSEAEERRLLFVGMTRARDTLELGHLACPAEPQATGFPSPFLEALPAALVEHRDGADPRPAPSPPALTAPGTGPASTPAPALTSPALTDPASTTASTPAPALTSPALTGPASTPAPAPAPSPAASPWAPGQRVKHARYGVGTIVEVSGGQVACEFGKLGAKSFPLKLCPLTPVDGTS